MGGGKTCAWLRLPACLLLLAANVHQNSAASLAHIGIHAVGVLDHPGLPPSNDGNMSWSLGDRAYVNNGGTSCSSDYFEGSGREVVCPDNKDYATANFTDYANLQGMLDDLRYASAKQKASGQPFFLNYGLHRPHLPFHSPASFPDETGAVVNHWEKYGPTEKIALPKHQSAPKGMPGIAFTYHPQNIVITVFCVFNNKHPPHHPQNISYNYTMIRALD
jgi:hypothetical protein